MDTWMNQFWHLQPAGDLGPFGLGLTLGAATAVWIQKKCSYIDITHKQSKVENV